MRKLDYPTAPLVLGLVLGDAMEKALRQSLMMSQGDLSILLARSRACCSRIAALLLVVPLFKKFNASASQMIDRKLSTQRGESHVSHRTCVAAAPCARRRGPAPADGSPPSPWTSSCTPARAAAATCWRAPSAR
jgi:hypothetical protein